MVSNKHACLQFYLECGGKHVFVENLFFCTGLGSLALIVYVKTVTEDKHC